MIWLKDTKVKSFQWFYHKHFKTFKLIHKRANFFKHPQYFSYAHDPKFWIDWYEPKPVFSCEKIVTIDDAYVLENYSVDYKSKKNDVKNDLQNSDCVWVKIPNLEDITKWFIDEYIYFIELICNNNVFVEIMKDTSVLDDYYLNEKI